MVEQALQIKKAVEEIIAAKESCGGIESVYFVGCGGSLGALYPAKTFMERESKRIRSALINSNEFVHNPPRDFGKNSILCVACHKGNTPESIAAARLGKELGATVILLTWLSNSEIVPYGDYIVRYSFDSSQDHLEGNIEYAGEKPMCALYLAVEVVQQVEGYDHYRQFYEGANQITSIIESARKAVSERSKVFAQEHKEDKFIYTMASGAGYGAAYMESICIFMEMQWISSAAIHSGEFFHGPFEVTDENCPFVLQVSEGTNRELDERALRFLQKYAKRVEVLDARELGLGVVDQAVADYFNHSLFNNVYHIYNHELAQVRNHPLSIRRYMWKVEY